MEGSPQFNTLPGQPTDDSELAILLARSIIRSGGYVPEDAARAYAWWFDSHPFDIGRATTKALSAASRAMHAGTEAASAAHEHADAMTEANGALMRISPLGIYGWNMDAETLACHARADCSLTHPNTVCQDANVIVVQTIARAIRLGESAVHLYQWACGHARENRLHPRVQEALTNAGVRKPADYMHQQGWVMTALQNAFHQLRFASTLEEGIVETVAQGGDTDTNAAIAGALLGAIYGVEAIPAQWRAAVLSCKPERGAPGVHQPRPLEVWPVDCEQLAEGLVSHS